MYGRAGVGVYIGAALDVHDATRGCCSSAMPFLQSLPGELSRLYKNGDLFILRLLVGEGM